jgi:hypothetical protein
MSKLLSAALCLFCVLMGTVSGYALFTGTTQHPVLDAFFLLIGIVFANVFGVALYPKHMVSQNAYRDFAKIFTIGLVVWAAYAFWKLVLKGGV